MFRLHYILLMSGQLCLYKWRIIIFAVGGLFGYLRALRLRVVAACSELPQSHEASS